MRTIRVDDLTQSLRAGLTTYSVEASDLGWGPGEWPITVLLTGEGMGPDGQLVFRDEVIPAEGDYDAYGGGWIYRHHEDKSFQLDVLND